MRFAPAAAALSLIVAVQASVGFATDRAPDPRAVALATQGRAELSAGHTQEAIDAFEAALVVDPSFNAVLLNLAEAARADGLQGKAIHYYREALKRDPNSLAAIAGEGEALVEKGAVERARENLSVLKSRCGETCGETQQLAAAISAGPQIMTAEAVVPDNGVTQN